MDIPVGLRFRPTDEEIVDDYLRPKNFDDDTSHVDRFISTVTICRFDPWELPRESRIKLKDREWCFFSLKEKKYTRGDRQVRTTRSGFWKLIGNPTSIFRESGNRRQKIGERRVLIFIIGKETKSDWVMHEYHVLSSAQVMKYSICKVMFNGQEREIYSPSPAASEIENCHSLIPHVTNYGGLPTVSEGFKPQELQNPRLFSEFLDEQQENQMGESILRAIGHMSSDDWDSWLAHGEQSEVVCRVVSTQEERNDFRPKKSQSGVFIYTQSSGDSSDSDSMSQSVTTASIGTLSTYGSFGSQNHRIDQIKGSQESLSSSVELVTLTQEVSKTLRINIDTSEEKKKKKTPYDDMQGSQEVIEKKREGFYRMVGKFIKKIRLCSCIPRA